MAKKTKLVAEFVRRKVLDYEAIQSEIEALKAEMDWMASLRSPLLEPFICLLNGVF